MAQTQRLLRNKENLGGWEKGRQMAEVEGGVESSTFLVWRRRIGADVSLEAVHDMLAAPNHKRLLLFLAGRGLNTCISQCHHRHLPYRHPQENACK